MRTYQASVCLDERAGHAEGPVWDDRLGELLWVDLNAGLVRRANWDPPGLSVTKTYSLGEAVGAVAPCAEPGWIVASEFGFARLWPDGSLHKLAEPERGRGTRMNDGAADPRGRFWAGSMAHDRTSGAGSLYRFDGTEPVPVLAGVTISNGLAWRSPDEFYYIDTPTQRVDLVTATGRREPAFRIDPCLGAPDGMTIDGEGALWIAMWGGSAVVRFSPQGEVLARVEVAATQVSSCCFGGPGYATLFITTSQEGFTPGQSAAEPHAGKLFAVETGVAGLPADRYHPVGDHR